MNHLSDFVTHYGYWAVVVGCLLEGETLLVLAGFAAKQGYLNLPLVMALGAAMGAAGLPCHPGTCHQGGIPPGPPAWPTGKPATPSRPAARARRRRLAPRRHWLGQRPPCRIRPAASTRAIRLKSESRAQGFKGRGNDLAGRRPTALLCESRSALS